MAANFTNTIQLLRYAEEKALLVKLVQQLQKDFILANITCDIKNDIAVDDLEALLYEKIYLLLMEHFDSYLNLLYIIDVPEKVFKGIAVTDAVEVSQQVSFLILERELQKVLLKKKYSS